jgi:hypothetical protein
VQAERTKAVLPLLKHAPRVILLSGTPALSKPAELFPQLCSLLPAAKLTKAEFAERYCVGDRWDDMKGCQNQDELNLVLVCHCQSPIVTCRTCVPVRPASKYVLSCSRSIVGKLAAVAVWPPCDRQRSAGRRSTLS